VESGRRGRDGAGGDADGDGTSGPCGGQRGAERRGRVKLERSAEPLGAGSAGGELCFGSRDCDCGFDDQRRRRGGAVLSGRVGGAGDELCGRAGLIHGRQQRESVFLPRGEHLATIKPRGAQSWGGRHRQRDAGAGARGDESNELDGGPVRPGVGGRHAAGERGRGVRRGREQSAGPDDGVVAGGIPEPGLGLGRHVHERDVGANGGQLPAAGSVEADDGGDGGEFVRSGLELHFDGAERSGGDPGLWVVGFVLRVPVTGLGRFDGHGGLRGLLDVIGSAGRDDKLHRAAVSGGDG